MKKVILWLADTMGFTVAQAADLVVISLGVFSGSFVALCLFGIIYGIISSTRYRRCGYFIGIIIRQGLLM